MTEDNDNPIKYSDGLSFAGFLSHLLQKKERSALWLAGKIGVAGSTVNRWLVDDTGTGPREAINIERIADALELDNTQRFALFEKAKLRKLAKSYQELLQEQVSGDTDGQVTSTEMPKSENDEMYFPVGKTEEEQRQVASQIKVLRELGLTKRIVFVLCYLVLLAVTLFAYRSELIQVLRSLDPRSTPTPLIVPIPPPTELVPSVIFTPTATLVPTLDFFGATPVAVPSAGINIRSGPGTEYEIVQTSQSGDRLVLIGKNPEGTWWNVEFNGISGWVFGELVVTQNSDNVSAVVNYPPPPATSTPEPTPTTATPLPTTTEAPTPSPTETVGQQNAEPALGTQTLASFSKINLSAPGNLLLVQEASSSITIDAPENVLSAIYTKVEGDTLVIGVASSFQTSNPSIQYRVSTPNVDSITVSNAANVRANSLRTDGLNLSVNDASAIDIGSLDARAIFINISVAGRVTISSGRVVEQNVTIGEASNFSAANLSTDRATIQVGGAGSATVWVNSQLNATITDFGTIRYYGFPSTNVNVTGSGKFESLGPK